MADMTPADDQFHDPRDDPMWNESAWFSFMIPERNLMGGIHWHHRPNMDLTWHKVLMWDGHDGRGEEIYDCTYYDAFEVQPFSQASAAGNFDFSNPMGLTVRTIDPWKRYTIRYERNGCVLDFEWEAFMPPFSTPFGDKGKGWGVNNYQQGGSIQGTISLDGTVLEVDSPSNRDRSWGPRSFHHSWNSFPRHQWPWFNDGEGFAGNIYTTADHVPNESADTADAQTTTQDNFTAERVLNGWLYRDGEAAAVVDGSFEVVDRREDGIPVVVTMRGLDTQGREFRAEGRARNFLRRPAPAGLIAFPSLTEWTFDDGRVVFGQTTEVYPHELGRRLFRTRSGLVSETSR